MKKKLKNIVLTGFRATGKSTVGKLVARRLGYTFLDMDIALSHQLGASISEIVAQHGWPFFRQAEADLLQRLCTSSRMVIATGGGAIEQQREWRMLRRESFIVWLDADMTTIKQRMASDPVSAGQRPALLQQVDAGQDETAVLLQRRAPLYAAGSDLRLDTTGITPEALAAALHDTIRHMQETADTTDTLAEQPQVAGNAKQ